MTEGSSAEDFVGDCPHKRQKKQGRKNDLSLMDCAELIEIEVLLLRKKGPSAEFFRLALKS